MLSATAPTGVRCGREEPDMTGNYTVWTIVGVLAIIALIIFITRAL